MNGTKVTPDSQSRGFLPGRTGEVFWPVSADLILALVMLGFGVAFVTAAGTAPAWTPFCVMAVIAFMPGVLIIIPIGGADMRFSATVGERIEQRWHITIEPGPCGVTCPELIQCLVRIEGTCQALTEHIAQSARYGRG